MPVAEGGILWSGGAATGATGAAVLGATEMVTAREIAGVIAGGAHGASADRELSRCDEEMKGGGAEGDDGGDGSGEGGG
eukprot:4970102-Pleurochrysis_carterae.AAC.1